MGGTIDPAEVPRDLVDWLDGTEPAWPGLETERRLQLLQQAGSYFAAVCRRYRVPEADFVPALEQAVQQVRRDHDF